MKFYLLVLILISCSCVDKKNETVRYGNTHNDWLANYPRPNDFTPLSLIEKLKTDTSKGGLTMVDEFPPSWVTLQDIEKLIPLISSKQSCKCLVNPYSSNLPKANSDVGGYAILFINSYRNRAKIEIGLYKCITTNEQDVNEILVWWKDFKNKPLADRR